jgi:hypothetical protein
LMAPEFASILISRSSFRLLAFPAISHGLGLLLGRERCR